MIIMWVDLCLTEKTSKRQGILGDNWLVVLRYPTKHMKLLMIHFTLLKSNA